MSDQNTSPQPPPVPTTTTKKPEQQSPARTVVTVILIVFIIGMVVYMGNNYFKRQKYNEAIDAMDARDYQKAATLLEELRPSMSGDELEDCSQALAQCYIQIGTEPQRPHEEYVEYLKKAHEVDPESLNPQQRKAIGVAEPTKDDASKKK
ncbi:MAG: hypothetical protein ACOCXX_04150 [Planctomycetota bacterium]